MSIIFTGPAQGELQFCNLVKKVVTLYSSFAKLIHNYLICIIIKCIDR